MNFAYLSGRVLYPSCSSQKHSSKTIGGFLSSTKRFSKPRDISVKVADGEVPGPGEYNFKSSVVPGGSFVTRETRFKNVKGDEVPGPGSYEVSDYIFLFIINLQFISVRKNNTLHNFSMQIANVRTVGCVCEIPIRNSHISLKLLLLLLFYP